MKNKIRSARDTTPEVVAFVYGVTRETVMRWARSGKISSIKRGRVVSFNLRQVIADLEGGATSFGTTSGIFGIADAQTGFLLDSSSNEYECDSKVVRNRKGDHIGESYFNERITGSFEGWFPSPSGFSGTLASALTIPHNPCDEIIGSAVRSRSKKHAKISVIGINKDSSPGDYKRIPVKWNYSPIILA